MKKIHTETITKNNFETLNYVRTHTVLMDNTPEDGGIDFGATPKEHLCMALGSCTTMTLKTYLLRKSWECQLLKVNIDFDIKDGHSYFNVHITIQGDFDEKQKKRIKQIAKLCPVHKMLSSGNSIKESFEFLELIH